ncbi:prepilin-type N-terminal cleavage/methylation domain-containing protein [Patescibacteria group bacterium]|nr:prepilin-type N-terminal cleavage/methylation domain-containing protein [Patescibacteria group bacterium]
MFNLFKKTNKQKNFALQNSSLKTSGGFSLIELMVVMAIVTLITGITLFNHNTFSGGVALENLAYEIALAVRQAQFFGINVRAASTGAGGSTFNTGYGVYFNKANPTSFILFADTNNDRFYSGSAEIVEVYTMKRGNQIKYLCVDGGCSSPETSSLEQLQITFVRPEPDAVIKTMVPTLCGVGIETECGIAKIYVGSPSENVSDKIIVVGVTGFISVETSSQ